MTNVNVVVGVTDVVTHNYIVTAIVILTIVTIAMKMGTAQAHHVVSHAVRPAMTMVRIAGGLPARRVNPKGPPCGASPLTLLFILAI
jgi:hypothetical protein